MDLSYGWGYVAVVSGLVVALLGLIAFVALGLRALGRNAEEASAGRIPRRLWQRVGVAAILLALASPFMQYPIGRNETGAQEWRIGVPLPWNVRVVDERGSRSELPHLFPLLIVNAAIWLVTPHLVLRGVLRRTRRATV